MRAQRLAAFDSGIGGLSALAPFLTSHAGIEVVYLGDLANLPYGTKSPERLADLTRKNAERLLSLAGCEGTFAHFVVACNTASAHGLPSAQAVAQTHNVPVLGVLEPGCRQALRLSPKRVVVLGTGATIASASYETTLRRLNPSVNVVSKACPLFVPLVEDGLIEGPEVDGIIRRYLTSLNLTAGDVAILGCTHYPYLLKSLTKLYPDVRWVGAAEGLAADASFMQSLNALPRAPKTRLRLLFTDTTASRPTIDSMLAAHGLTNKIELSVETIRPD